MAVVRCVAPSVPSSSLSKVIERAKNISGAYFEWKFDTPGVGGSDSITCISTLPNYMGTAYLEGTLGFLLLETAYRFCRMCLLRISFADN